MTVSSAAGTSAGTSAPKGAAHVDLDRQLPALDAVVMGRQRTRNRGRATIAPWNDHPALPSPSRRPSWAPAPRATRPRRPRPAPPAPRPPAAQKPSRSASSTSARRTTTATTRRTHEGALVVAQAAGRQDPRGGERPRDGRRAEDDGEHDRASTGLELLFPTSFGYFDPHILKVAARSYPKVTFLHCGGLYEEGKHPAERRQLLRLHRRGAVRLRASSPG